MANPLRFYTTESLSATSKRGWTPEGFLLCQDVPIARVGILLYGRGEIPVQANADGIIRIIRDPDEVFHDNAILSFAGKPLTDEHPPSKVNPDNWKQYSKGTVLNPHRGDGRTENNELLYADLLVQDRRTIQDVLDGKVEVSAGYDAEYEQVKPGEGKQHNIIGNHVALVLKGRCGPICSIGDSVMPKVVKVVKGTASQRRFRHTRDAILSAFQTGDEETLVDELDKVEDMMGNTSEGGPVDVGGKGGSNGGTTDDMGGTHVHIHTGSAQDDAEKPPAAAAAAPAAPGGPPSPASPGGDPGAGAGGGVTLEQLASRIDQLEQAVAILAQGEGGDDDTAPGPDENSPGMSGTPPDNKDRATVGDRRRATVGDSSSMAMAYQELIARAELLLPGQRYPTFDAAKPAKITADSMCNFRRTTLDSALAKGADAKDAIMAIAGSPKDPSKYLKALSCDAVTVVFNGASEIVRKAGMSNNNGGAAPPAGLRFGSGTVSTVQDTVANINRINRERFGITGR